MNHSDIDLVFGRGRQQMDTGAHVEVFREAWVAGQPRLYSKRFLATAAVDLTHWTNREARVLARLSGRGLAVTPRLARFDPSPEGGLPQLHTHDAGVTVDHWVNRVPVQRAGRLLGHAFEDCAHWWALARHCLLALDALHGQGVVHLDLKADNLCIPYSPAGWSPGATGTPLTLCFAQLTLIDFAFCLDPDDPLEEPLPLARLAQHDHQSPRLLLALEAGRAGDLAPTRALDWRCDLFSLAAMLRRYLPGPNAASAGSWTPWFHQHAQTLIGHLLQAHDADAPAARPHHALLALTKQALADAPLRASLAQGFTVPDGVAPEPRAALRTPLTRLDLPEATQPTPAPAPAPAPAPPSAPTSASGPAPAHDGAPTSISKPAAVSAKARWRFPGWVVATTAGAALLGGAWWLLRPQPSIDRIAVAAFAQQASAARASSLWPAAGASSEPASAPATDQPPLPAATPSAALTEPAPPTEVEQAASPPSPAASGIVANAMAPTSAVTEPEPLPPAAQKARPAARRVAPRRDATGELPPIDPAEHRRALEWLEKRGPAPLQGRKPPASHAADSSP
ncbi:MAG: hypothetical protein ACOZJX_00325 [Pseudomonadota bacterium]